MKLSDSIFLWLIFLMIGCASYAQTHDNTIIVDSNIKKDDSKQGQIDSIFNFTRNHLFVFPGYSPINDSPINILIRGIGWCDQQSYVFIKLLEEIGTKGRVIFLYRKDQAQEFVDGLNEELAQRSGVSVGKLSDPYRFKELTPEGAFKLEGMIRRSRSVSDF